MGVFSSSDVMMLFCLQSLLGEFNKEQEAFIKEKQGKVSDAAVPPWVGCPNEESLKEEFLTLSTVSALKFIHTFFLITATFFITHQATSYTHNIACPICLCIRLHSQHLLALRAAASGYDHNSCLHCMLLHQVTITTVFLAVG
jgi:hypothetical protein